MSLLGARMIPSGLQFIPSRRWLSPPGFDGDAAEPATSPRRASYAAKATPIRSAAHRIERIRVAGRGTNACPRCQPAP